MKFIPMAAIAATIAIAPVVSVWADSDGAVQTKSAAVAGARVGSPGVSKKPTSGTAGGGMSTASGKKAGGLSKQNKSTLTGASN
ncbi:hypothetical protein [Acidisoma silvae]|uniref:Uncharacterized protein n=1 Tax=Acidisoma silvae TaxID=2802396 RepID=A0A964E1C7_9PROT|nr:hypothetical protein [Acidisoma silvae]MCB8877623.1 hypothetical protein [Acidisoma silvae]